MSKEFIKTDDIRDVRKLAHKMCTEDIIQISFMPLRGGAYGQCVSEY